MGHKRNKGAKKQAFKAKMKFNRKEMKEHSKEKRARLIVKNLPFKATEENLKSHYEQFGQVKEVKLLKRPDGKLVGCGFIQFDAVQQAAKARHHTNKKQFLGREIECDFAISKDRYLKKINNEKKAVEVKEEPVDTSVVKIEDVDIKEEVESLNDEVEEIENTLGDKEKATKSDEKNDFGLEEEEEDDDCETEDEEEDDDVKEEPDVKEEDSKPRVVSNDVTEGKTVFVKNIPFEATKEDLKECMLQFGPLYYALICVDRLTEHSKGTGFVKYRNKEDAEKCLQAGTELKLLGNILDCHPALNKTDLQKKTEKIEKKPTDSRNLYLVKEGVILAGSKSAEGVSSADMAKRLQLEQYKTQMLRNLNMFISRNRLIIHNLPISWDDSKVRALFKKHAGTKAFITEAKIMRDLKNVDSKGIGQSKQYGFVTFATHEHAINALRSLNNNPDIFGAANRPIVAFSIENRVMIKAREKRVELSRKKNPLCKEFTKSPAPKHPEIKDVETKDFVGVSATPGIKKMRSRFNLKTQAKIHHEYLKGQKKKKKHAAKTLQEKKQDFIKQPKQKVNKSKNTDDSFAKMVNDYKRKLIGPTSNSSNMSTNKKKWFE